jgi:hypothetical protein
MTSILLTIHITAATSQMLCLQDSAVFSLSIAMSFRTSIWRFIDSKFLLFCFVLQIDIDHRQCAVWNIVVLSSGSGAVFASATAANCFLASGRRRRSDCLQFMNKSVCACICVSACTGSRSSDFLARCAQNRRRKSSRSHRRYRHDVWDTSFLLTFSDFRLFRLGPTNSDLFRLIPTFTLLFRLFHSIRIDLAIF